MIFSSADLVIYRWPAPQDAKDAMTKLIPMHDTNALLLVTPDGRADHQPLGFSCLLTDALVMVS
jgi:hypothetical protein